MIRGGKSQGIADANFRLGFGDVLEILWPDIATVDDDEIFLAPRDRQHAVRHVADITGVKPVVFAQGVASFLWKAKIPGHDAGPAQINDAAVPVVEHIAVVIANFNLEARKGHAAVDEVATAAV